MHVLGLGAAAMDIVLQCPELPREDGFAFVNREQLLPGGSCANVLAALANLGSQAAMVAAIGDDNYGTIFRMDLEQTGVNTDYLVTRPGGTTLHTFVVVATGGARSIFCNLGSSLLTLREDEVSPSMLEGVKVFYTDMFPGAPALKLACLSRERGIPVVFNLECTPSFMQLCGISRDQLEKMAGLTDLFFTGREALSEFTGCPDLEAASRQIYEQYRPAQGVVATWGDKGAVWLREGEVLTAPTFRVEAIDTTGAGDALAGGLIHGYFMKKLHPSVALEFASACAAIKCTQLGARLRAGEPEVKEFLAQRR